jgi:hypothetical protein
MSSLPFQAAILGGKRQGDNLVNGNVFPLRRREGLAREVVRHIGLNFCHFVCLKISKNSAGRITRTPNCAARLTSRTLCVTRSRLPARLYPLRRES